MKHSNDFSMFIITSCWDQMIHLLFFPIVFCFFVCFFVLFWIYGINLHTYSCIIGNWLVMKVFSAKDWTTTQDRIFQESKLKKNKKQIKQIKRIQIIFTIGEEEKGRSKRRSQSKRRGGARALNLLRVSAKNEPCQQKIQHDDSKMLKSFNRSGWTASSFASAVRPRHQRRTPKVGGSAVRWVTFRWGWPPATKTLHVTLTSSVSCRWSWTWLRPGWISSIGWLLAVRPRALRPSVVYKHYPINS